MGKPKEKVTQRKVISLLEILVVSIIVELFRGLFE